MNNTFRIGKQLKNIEVILKNNIHSQKKVAWKPLLRNTLNIVFSVKNTVYCILCAEKGTSSILNASF